MKKTILMLLGFAVIFGASVACFGPSTKRDKDSPIYKENAPQASTAR